MVKLRLKRIGKKFSAFYKVVAADARAPRDGRFIEDLGSYDPYKKNVILEQERIHYWLKKGAQPTQTVKNLLQKQKIWAEFKNTKQLAKKRVVPAENEV